MFCSTRSYCVGMVVACVLAVFLPELEVAFIS